MPDIDPSALAAVTELRERYPNTPFLTLGQTVLWDEPLKAAFCRVLEAAGSQAGMVAAVHDTDYFAKLTHAGDSQDKFVLLPHNDGDTRDLWSAAGEISCLFGSEVVPTRQLLTENGVAFDLVARGYPGGVTALLNDETAAWGWRALVHAGQRPLIAGDVRLADIAPALRDQLRWAFDESLRIARSLEGEEESKVPEAGCQCARPCNRQEAAARLHGWVDEYIQLHPDHSLSDLYQWLTPKLWSLLRGGSSCQLETGHSLDLFRFNRSTASLPRFRFLDLFLQPATRDTARRCYNEAVARGRSGIYTLDQFEAGALPFDVVIPGRGRGTLRLHQGSLFIQTEEPITLCLDCNCSSVGELSGLLERELGDKVAVVGKAVALISMLAHEFIFVFHEKASSYTRLTQRMNELMRAEGIELNLHPMLRLQHSTWNAVGASNAVFELPPHIAQAFGSARIAAEEFSQRWEAVCKEQDGLRLALKECRSPRELLTLLAGQGDEEWAARLHRYETARQAIRRLSERARALEAQVSALRELAAQNKKLAGEIERAKGDDFRARVQPLRSRIFDIKEGAARRLNPVDAEGNPRRPSKEERAAEAQLAAAEADELAGLGATIEGLKSDRRQFDLRIEDYRGKARAAQQEARQRVLERVALERSADAVAARATINELEYEAELERLRRVRDTILVSNGLRYTDYRPTAWWLPLVSPDGRWFDRMVETMTARLEAL